MITGMEHAGLSVVDLDRSVAFYRDLLGFEVLRILDCKILELRQTPEGDSESE